jgi:hypothetical protein
MSGKGAWFNQALACGDAGYVVDSGTPGGGNEGNASRLGTLSERVKQFLLAGAHLWGSNVAG